MNLDFRFLSGRSATSLFLMLGLLGGVSLLSEEPARAAEFETGIRVYKTGDYPTAIKYFKEALRSQEDNPYVHYYLADALVKSNRIREAEWEYRQIIAMAPESQAARLSKIGLTQIKHFNEETGSRFSAITTSSQDNNGPDYIEGLATNEDNYLADVEEGGILVRWSVKSPIKLYVEKSPVGIRNFEPSFLANVKRAMDAWMKALGNRVSYVQVDRPDHADIKVTWVNTIDTHGHTTESGTTYTAGVTLPEINNERLVAMDVKLSTFDIRQKPQSTDEIYLLALHELGHALGLRGHSDNKSDIMFAQNQNVSVLSRRDINTIRKLYGQEVDVTNLPPKKKNDPEREKRIAEKLDQEIIKMEALVQQSGSHLNLNNLGSTYFQKGKSLAKAKKEASKPEDKSAPGDAQTDKTAPKYWYDKALDSFNQAIKLEPNDPSTYYNRCIVYEEMNQLPSALEDIQSAIRNAPKENKYYLEKAIILTNLKRKAEALSALNDYIIRDPGASNSEQVQKVRRIVNKI